jgi:hypothetical protein
MRYEIDSVLLYDLHRAKIVFPERQSRRTLMLTSVERRETRGSFAPEYSPQTATWRIEDLELVLNHNLECFAKGEEEKVV